MGRLFSPHDDRCRLRGKRFTRKLETCFRRCPVGLHVIDRLVAGDEVLKGVWATAVTRDDVIQRKCRVRELLLRVLTDAPVALPNG